MIKNKANAEADALMIKSKAEAKAIIEIAEAREKEAQKL